MIVFSTLEELNWYLERQPVGQKLEIDVAISTTGIKVYEVTWIKPIIDRYKDIDIHKILVPLKETLDKI